MLTVSRTLKLRDGSSSDTPNTQGVVRTGDIIEETGIVDGDWTRVRVHGPGTSIREGWIKTIRIVERDAPPAGTIDPEKFALVCLYSARDFETNGYYLVALAHALSGIENKVNSVTKARGPFQFTIENWNSLISLHSNEFEDIGPQDIDDPYIQCIVAALTTKEATEQLQSALPDKRLPTSAELYLCQLLGLPLTKNLLSGDPSAKVDELLLSHFSNQTDAASAVADILTKHADILLISGQPSTIEQILEGIGKIFDEGLARAGELIDALPDDENFSTPDNSDDAVAPWMIFAKAEVGQTEDMRKGQSNPRIQEYHVVSHPASPRLDDIAWCAAFISWCLAQCDDEKIKKSNIKSALAADWIKWGRSVEQPIYGSIVVMEPLVAGSSGHVGFSMGVDGDHVLLLGGNQRDLEQVGHPDAVCIRKFRLSKVRGFRWLDGVNKVPADGAAAGSGTVSITVGDLQAISGTRTRSHVTKQIANAFNKHADEFGVTSQKSIAQALANFSVETGGFRHLEENLNYSAGRLMEVWPTRFKTFSKAKLFERNPKKLANEVYGNRLGNKGKPNAGWLYRGSGPGQVTGFDNFKTVEDETGLKVTTKPEILRQADSGMKAALMLWKKWGLSEKAENDQTTAIRKRWNGGSHGLAKTKAAYARAMKRKLGK